jgi:cold shock CspA family protein
MTGTVIRILLNRGFGFVRGMDGLSYFMHAKDVSPRVAFDTMHEGQRVEFTPQPGGDRGPRAIEIKVSSECSTNSSN